MKMLVKELSYIPGIKYTAVENNGILSHASVWTVDGQQRMSFMWNAGNVRTESVIMGDPLEMIAFLNRIIEHIDNNWQGTVYP